MALTDNFPFYSDYFAFIAESGLNRAIVLFPSIATSTIVDPRTIDLPENSVAARRNFSRALDLAYESIWLDGQSLPPIRKAFDGLAAWVLADSGQTVDDFLTIEGIQVEPLYATLSAIFDQTIQSSNIKG